MTTRRSVLTLLGGAAVVGPRGAWGQQQGRTYRVGLLAPGQMGPADERRRAILQGLAARGFIEGRNLVFDVRWGEGRYERLSEAVAALKNANTDVRTVRSSEA